MKPLIFWSILAMLLMIGCPWLAEHLQAAREWPSAFCCSLGSIPYFLLYAAYLQERTSSGCGPFQLLSRIISGRGVAILCDG